ncbi:hypothetical protein POG22_12705 [Geitlerinema sp. CS-897]|nr:hypothetical protein [Geitlerinema sp. CS-897]
MSSAEKKSNNSPENLRDRILKNLNNTPGKTLSELASTTQESDENLRVILEELKQEQIVCTDSPNPNKDLVYRLCNNQKDTTKNQEAVGLKSEKTNWLELAPSIKIATILWSIVVVVVILPLIGQFFIAKSFQSELARDRSKNLEGIETVDASKTPEVDWVAYEQIIRAKLQHAREEAKVYASSELEKWGDDLVSAVDNNFLDWYFGYFNQKAIEYKGFFTGINAHIQKWLDPNSKNPEERIAEEITEEFQVEFAKRVLRPSISQMRLNRIAEQTSKKYIKTLKQDLNNIPYETGISRLEWQKYLRDTSVDIPDVEGNIVSFPLMRVTTAGCISVLQKHQFWVAKFPISISRIRSPASWRCRGSGN